MRSKVVAYLMADLGITKTHSRPHVSNDNPNSETQFKTLKYCPQFPDRFESIQDSRNFCHSFFNWYNKEHRHSSIALTIPEQLNYEMAWQVYHQRAEVTQRAFNKYPNRLRYKIPIPELPPTAA